MHKTPIRTEPRVCDLRSLFRASSQIVHGFLSLILGTGSAQGVTDPTNAKGNDKSPGKAAGFGPEAIEDTRFTQEGRRNVQGVDRRLAAELGLGKVSHTTS